MLVIVVKKKAFKNTEISIIREACENNNNNKNRNKDENLGTNHA